MSNEIPTPRTDAFAANLTGDETWTELWEKSLDVMNRLERDLATQAAETETLRAQVAELQIKLEGVEAVRDGFREHIAGLESQNIQLQSRLDERSKEVERVNEFRENLRRKFWAKDEQIATLSERLEKAVEALTGLAKEIAAWKEIADCILFIVKEEDFPKDALWIPTIQAHAQVISWDTEAALASISPANGKAIEDSQSEQELGS